MLDNVKNLYINAEKFKASYSQSKTTGQLYFDVSLTASNIKELKEQSMEAVKTCIEVCNAFNADVQDNNGKEKDKKGKQVQG